MGYDVKTRIEACILDSSYPDEFVETMIKQLEEVYAKAKAFDRIKVIHDKNVYEMSISDTECIEMIGNELEDE